MKRFITLSFENDAHQTSYRQYFLPTVLIKDYDVTIDRQNLFYQIVKNNLRTYDINRKIGAGQGGDCTIGCFLDYDYIKYNYKLIAISLSKQKALDADPKAMQKISFTGSVTGEGLSDTTMLFIIEAAKETLLDFSH